MEKKTFAFRLADKSPRDTGKWKAREGVLAPACTEAFHPPYVLRYNLFLGYDNGGYC